MRSVRTGDSGPEVRDIQQRLVDLGFAIDPSDAEAGFGASTDNAVRAFQRSRSLRVDGMVGPDTWGQLVEAGYRLGDRSLYIHAPVYRGDDVRALQRKLNALGFDAGREDGMFGPATERAVREFQRNVGDAVDGMVGFATVRMLQRMRPVEDGPGRAMVREGEELRRRHGSLEGSVIVIDPGPSDAGSDANMRIALALRDALAARGAKPEVLGDAGEDPSPTERAGIANELGAALCLSLHLDEGVSEGSGPTCSYFGSLRTHSPAGQALALHILDELELALDRRGRLQRLTAALLRGTRMPAVQIEPVAGPEEARLLDDESFVKRVADAIAAGAARYFAASGGGPAAS